MVLGESILALRAAMQNRGVTPAEKADLAKGSAAQFPVTAQDLMPDYEGPTLGAKLNELEAQWLASGCTLTRDALLS